QGVVLVGLNYDVAHQGYTRGLLLLSDRAGGVRAPSDRARYAAGGDAPGWTELLDFASARDRHAVVFQRRINGRRQAVARSSQNPRAASYAVSQNLRTKPPDRSW